MDRIRKQGRGLKGKVRFTELLADLCSDISQPEQTKGRLQLPLSDILYVNRTDINATFYETEYGQASRL